MLWWLTAAACVRNGGPRYAPSSPPTPPCLPQSAGLGLGVHAGHGLLLARLPARHEQETPRWSSPVFLRVTVGQVGLIMGYEQVRSCMHVSWCTYNPRGADPGAMGQHWPLPLVGRQRRLLALPPLHLEGGGCLAGSSRCVCAAVPAELPTSQLPPG
jgi:hypothetical protein